jgi:phosphonate transport system substrate-binding protein
MEKRIFLQILSGSMAAGLSWGSTPLRAQTTPVPANPTVAKARTPAAARRSVFGLITPRNAEATLKSWTPFLERMSMYMGQPIEPKTYAQQGELVEDFKKGLLDYAWVGNVPAIELAEASIAGVFGQLVVKGQFAYRSLLIVPSNSTPKTVDDLIAAKGKYVMSDGDLRSTSGHVVPRYFAFAKRGVNDPDTLFKEVKRGSHLDNLNRVAKSEVDVATNNTTELDIFRQTQPDAAKNIRVIWESPDIPESPLVWRLALPQATRRKAQDFIVSFGKTGEEKQMLREMNNLTGFRKSSNLQLVPIADLEMFNGRQRLVNDKNLTAEERTKKIDEIIKRGTRLEFLLKRV